MNQLEYFKIVIRVEIGSVINTSFWKEVWCTQQPLMREVLVIYEIAQNKDARVAELRKEGGRGRVGCQS